jgi:hypothetical protein
VARLVSGPECTPSHESPGRPYGTACVLIFHGSRDFRAFTFFRTGFSRNRGNSRGGYDRAGFWVLTWVTLSLPTHFALYLEPCR